MRTFSSVWYWLSLAVMWSILSHWILGVPFDLVVRARQNGGQTMDDLEMLVGINVRRVIALNNIAELWLAGFAAFVLAGTATAGFYYNLEWAQGLFCMGLPLTIIGAINLHISKKFNAEQPRGPALASALIRLRLWVNILALMSIFITAMYGMYHNLTLPIGF